jgi:hypothetical protein
MPKGSSERMERAAGVIKSFDRALAVWPDG